MMKQCFIIQLIKNYFDAIINYTFHKIQIVSIILLQYFLNFNIQIQKTQMEKLTQNIQINSKHIIRPFTPKENIIACQSPQLSSRFTKAQSIYPHQRSTLPHQQWKTTVTSLLPNRLTSPTQSMTASQETAWKKPEFIQLGGSKQKRISTEKDQSVNLSDSRKIEVVNVNVEGYVRKIGLLEARIRQLHKEKQQISMTMNEKIQKLQLDNEQLQVDNRRLTQTVANFQHIEKDQNIQVCALPLPISIEKVQTEQTEQEFNLQEMLSSQISINLQLRQSMQILKTQLQVELSKVKQFSQQKQDLQIEAINLKKIQHDQLSKKEVQINQVKADYQQQINDLQAAISKRQQAVEEIIQEKQKRILQLEGLSNSIQHVTSEEKTQLESEIILIKQEWTHLLEQKQSMEEQIKSKDAQIQEANAKNRELQERQQCKKCKQLMYTVFRLNSQLNKK